MIFVIVVLIALVLTILMGGKLENFKYCRFNHVWFVFLAATVKIISFSSLRFYFGITDEMIPFFRIASMMLVILFIVSNLKIRGMPLVGAGLLGNALAIITNGGYMPVRSDYVSIIATGSELERLKHGLPAFNFVAAGQDTNLYFLSDIILMPKWVPLSQVFSIGDILVTVGAVFFIVYHLKYRSPGNLT